MYKLTHRNEHPILKGKKLHHSKLVEFFQKEHWEIKGGISEHGVFLYKKMLSFDPESRYTANEALNHPWITRNFSDNVPLNG